MRYASIALVLGIASTSHGANEPPGNRAMGAGHYLLEIDGKAAGWVEQVQGGEATSDVVTEKTGADTVAKKHLGGVKYTDITLRCGTGMSSSFYEWMKEAIAQNPKRHNGAIVFTDYDRKEIQRLNFFNAIITEVELPALDAASREAARITIKMAPEITRRVMAAGGAGQVVSSPMDPAKQKQWLTSNFRLTLDDPSLQSGATKTSKIEPLDFEEKSTGSAVGALRDYQKTTPQTSTPNLVITLPESHAEGFYKWREQAAVQGKPGAGQMKSGRLDYLTPDMREALFTITFTFLNHTKTTEDKTEGQSEQIRKVK